MESNHCVEYLNFRVDLDVTVAGGGDGGGEVVEDHLNNLNLFREACGRWNGGMDDSPKRLYRLEDGIVGGGTDSYWLDVLFTGEADCFNPGFR